MRTLEYGKFAAENAHFTRRGIAGESVNVDGSVTNSVTTQDPAYQCIVGARAAGYAGHQKQLWKIALAGLRATMGYTPIIVSARLWGWQQENLGVSPSLTVSLYRLVVAVDYTDATYRYRDATGSVAWSNDAYSPYPGKDILATAFATCVVPTRASGATAAYSDYWEVGRELAARLRAGADFEFVMQHPKFSATIARYAMFFSTAGKYPYLDIKYFLPFEFYASKAGNGDIDLTRPLDNAVDVTLDLGAFERGETSTPTAIHLKSFVGRTVAHLDVLDDHPEWSTPEANSGNAGSGVLGYVNLTEAAESQDYTIEFTSGTAFTVTGAAYRDNTESFGSVGSGDTSGNFTASDGGLSIPSAAWSGSPQAGDIITFQVTGNTTDPAWAADSGDMLQIARDDGTGLAADAATWRPAKGRRTITTGSVTIDATSKAIPVRHIDTSKWSSGDKIFIADAAHIDEGVIDTVDSADQVTVTFASATSNVYAAGAKVCTSLPLRNLASTVYALSTGLSGVSQTTKNYIPLTNAAAIGFSGGDTIAIQSPTDPENTYEECTISSVSASGITLAAYLTVDYPVGSFVAVRGAGEVKLWVRVAISALSTLEYKHVRLNVRI